MHTTDDTHDRLMALEIKTTFTEDQLDQLDKVVIRQQQQIDWLIRELNDLRQHTAPGDSSVTRNLRDELPPHY